MKRMGQRWKFVSKEHIYTIMCSFKSLQMTEKTVIVKSNKFPLTTHPKYLLGHIIYEAVL
jgi:hypothetical protein